MRRKTHTLSARLLAAALAALGVAPQAALVLPRPALAAADDAARITAVDVAGDGDEATLSVRGTKAPTFTVFRLDKPARIVVDLANADVSAVSALGRVAGKGPVEFVTATQFDDARAKVGRLVLTVKDGAKYDVKANGTDVVIVVRAQGAAPAVAAAPKADDKVVRVEVDSLPEGVKSGSKVLSADLTAKAGVATLAIEADGPVARYEMVELKEPGRLALDLDGFTAFEKPRHAAAGPVTALRLGKHDGKVRVVLEAKGDRFPPFEIRRTERGLSVSVGKAIEEKPVAMKESAPEKPVVAEKAAAPSTSAAQAAAEVRSVDVSGKGRVSRIVVVLTKDARAEEEKAVDGTLALTIHGTKLPKELARRLDASALEGPVAAVATYAVPGTDATRVVVTLRDGETATPRLSTMQVGPSVGVVWTFTSEGPRTIAKAGAQQPTLLAQRGMGGFMGEAPAYAATAAPRANGYTGRRVDFTAKDLDIIQFLQAIGEISKKNIVAADDVSGKVSIRLRNVPWDEALDIVLKTKNLGRQEVGNIIRVAPLETLQKERKAEAENKVAEDKILPLKVRLIPVNYAEASSLVPRIKDLLTPERGTVSVDERTNVVIVKDIVDVLAKAELLVRNLDTQTPQVLIEARIVEAQTSFTRSVGIQWGGDVAASPATGNPTGLIFPNLVSIAGAATDGATPLSAVSPTPNFAVNMPTAIGTNTGGGVGFIFGSAGGAANLNLRLSAAEVNGTVKTVSSPKVTTMDNQQASIGQGISIPFSQVSAAGVNTTFIEAKLQLDVTPHVTSDGSILLKIKAANNQPNPQLTGSNGQPSISKREANTNVIVKDGDTTVIGGIYTRLNSLESNEVPFFSKIPILGRLFSKQTTRDDRTEMLIFITPRIVNRQQSVVASGDAQ